MADLFTQTPARLIWECPAKLQLRHELYLHNTYVVVPVIATICLNGSHRPQYF